MTLSDRFFEAVTRWEAANGKRFNGADLARSCGFERQTVGDWKTGRTKTIDYRHIFCVAKYLDVNPVWLNEGKGSIEPSSSPSTGINRQILAKAIQAVEAVVSKHHYQVTDDEKANITAIIYDEMLDKDSDELDREIAILLKASGNG